MSNIVRSNFFFLILGSIFLAILGWNISPAGEYRGVVPFLFSVVLAISLVTMNLIRAVFYLIKKNQIYKEYFLSALVIICMLFPISIILLGLGNLR